MLLNQDVSLLPGPASQVSGLIEASETSPTASQLAGFEVRIRTDQHYTTGSGSRVAAWAIYDELPTSEANGEDEEGEPLLKVVSGKDLSG